MQYFELLNVVGNRAYVCMYVCRCIYVYLYIYVYTYIHTYIHIFMYVHTYIWRRTEFVGMQAHTLIAKGLIHL